MITQNPTYYKRVVLDTDRTAFYFDSILNYNRFIAEKESNVPTTSNARRGFDRINDNTYVDSKLDDYRGLYWFGTRDTNAITQPLNSFLFNNQLDNFLQNLRDSTVSVDKTDIEQVKRIKFTEMEIGIFSFDLASLGLLPVMEYYSPTLKRVVSGNYVLCYKDNDNKPIKDENGATMFYHIFVAEIPQHVVEFDGEANGYYSTVLNKVVEKDELVFNEKTNQFFYPKQDEIPQHAVLQSQKLDENGNKKWTTTWKKSFIYIPKVLNPLPRIDIIVASSFPYTINAETEMIYNGMAAITLAEKLSASNINYRIIVAYPILTAGSGATKGIYTYVVAKQDGEALDKNNIAILLSDARQGRLQKFKGDYATQYDAGFDTNIGVGSVSYIIADKMFVDKQLPTEGNGDKYIIRDLDGTVRNGVAPQSRSYTQEFDTQKDAYDFITRRGLSVDRAKIAYVDYLAQSTEPLDIASSKIYDSKILFSGATSEQQATDQYNNAIRMITNIR
jgi:hypothetical protein